MSIWYKKTWVPSNVLAALYSQILQQSTGYKTTFTDSGEPYLTCNSIIWTGSGSTEQRKAFVQLQKAASSLMLAGGRSFEQVVKQVGGIYKKLAADVGESFGWDDAPHTCWKGNVAWSSQLQKTRKGRSESPTGRTKQRRKRETNGWTNRRMTGMHSCIRK
jgi:tape measure domain-containing protein